MERCGKDPWWDEYGRRVVDNGTSTYFLTDTWVGDIPLCDMFSRLFDLFDNRLVTMAYMCHLGWGEKLKGGGCLHEKKILLEHVVLCFIILFCKTTNQTGGNDF